MFEVVVVGKVSDAKAALSQNVLYGIPVQVVANLEGIAVFLFVTHAEEKVFLMAVVLNVSCYRWGLYGLTGILASNYSSGRMRKARSATH